MQSTEELPDISDIKAFAEPDTALVFLPPLQRSTAGQIANPEPYVAEAAWGQIQHTDEADDISTATTAEGAADECAPDSRTAGSTCTALPQPGELVQQHSSETGAGSVADAGQVGVLTAIVILQRNPSQLSQWIAPSLLQML